MADKQFARSGPAEFDVLADDDPLAELARIVGYDARPAVQQLQELQRHQEAVRQDPAFDLEGELLRAFDSYDAPRSAPQPAPIEEPRFEPVAEHVVVHEEPVAEPVAELDEPVFVQPERVEAAPAPVADEDYAEVHAFSVAPQVAEDGNAEAVVDEPAFDLERELELSLGEADLLSDDVAEVAAHVEPQDIDPRDQFVDAWQAPAVEAAPVWAEPAPVADAFSAYEQPRFDVGPKSVKLSLPIRKTWSQLRQSSSRMLAVTIFWRT